jgi:hypothetical protein
MKREGRKEARGERREGRDERRDERRVGQERQDARVEGKERSTRGKKLRWEDRQ